MQEWKMLVHPRVFYISLHHGSTYIYKRMASSGLVVVGDFTDLPFRCGVPGRRIRIQRVMGLGCLKLLQDPRSKGRLDELLVFRA